MITARICDRCKEPVDNKYCSTVTRTYSGPYLTVGPDVNDLCNKCMIELQEWFKIDPKEILEARKTPLMRYAEELRARAETMPLKEAVGEVPEGIIVFYPDERYGLVSFEKDLGMTILGDKAAYVGQYGKCTEVKSTEHWKKKYPCVVLHGFDGVECESFMLGGREGCIADAKKLGRRLTEKKKW